MLTDDQGGHLARVIGSHEDLVVGKYVAGQKEHGGDCWKKPAMLRHGLEEVADLTVYLWTVREQMLALASRADLPLWARDEIKRIVGE